MRYRLLVVFPLAWALAFLALNAAFLGTPEYRTFLRIEIELAKGMALFGSWAAALAFARGEYLRKAWFLIGLCMALLLLRDLTLFLPGLAGLGERNLEALRSGIVLLGNVSQVIGTWLLARAWKVADLSLPGSGRGRGWVTALAVLLAAAFAGPGVLTNLQRVLAGDLGALTGAASALGDMISLCLIAPLLLTALALRGGLFGWPWSLMTTSYVAWLLYDAVLVLGPWFGLGPDAARSGSELFRGLGCTFGLTAGLAQRFVVAELRHLAPRPPAA